MYVSKQKVLKLIKFDFKNKPKHIMSNKLMAPCNLNISKLCVDHDINI